MDAGHRRRRRGRAPRLRRRGCRGVAVPTISAFPRRRRRRATPEGAACRACRGTRPRRPCPGRRRPSSQHVQRRHAVDVNCALVGFAQSMVRSARPHPEEVSDTAMSRLSEVVYYDHRVTYPDHRHDLQRGVRARPRALEVLGVPVLSRAPGARSRCRAAPPALARRYRRVVEPLSLGQRPGNSAERCRFACSRATSFRRLRRSGASATPSSNACAVVQRPYW